MTPRTQYREEFSLSPYMRFIIRAMMKQEGRNFRKCELCGGSIPEGKYQLHHEKYEGATYQDLKIVCQKCNLAPENVGLN